MRGPTRDLLSVRLSLQPHGCRQHPLAFLPGEVIAGTIEILSVGPLEVTDVTLRLEGTPCRPAKEVV